MEIIISSILPILLNILIGVSIAYLTGFINDDLPPYIFLAFIIVFIIVNYWRKRKTRARRGIKAPAQWNHWYGLEGCEKRIYVLK